MDKPQSIADALAETGGLKPGPGTPSKKRKGKKGILFYQLPAVIKHLKLLALAENKTQHALLVEALNLLFKQYGVGQIAS